MFVQDVEMSSFPVKDDADGFEVLCPTMFFQEKPRVYEQVAPKPYVGPLALPTDPKQCVHVEMNVDEEGFAKPGEPLYMRCKSTASKGFLCGKHDNQVFALNPIKKANLHNDWVKKRDYHAEVVDSIIKTEKRALASAAVEVVKLTTNGSATIRYVKDNKVHKPIEEVLTPEEIHRLVEEAQELGLYEA